LNRQSLDGAVTDRCDPNYLKLTDTRDTLVYDSLSRVIGGLWESVRELAEVG
jgi:hypothetical protein